MKFLKKINLIFIFLFLSLLISSCLNLNLKKEIEIPNKNNKEKEDSSKQIVNQKDLVTERTIDKDDFEKHLKIINEKDFIKELHDGEIKRFANNEYKIKKSKKLHESLLNVNKI